MVKNYLCLFQLKKDSGKQIDGIKQKMARTKPIIFPNLKKFYKQRKIALNKEMTY